MVRPRPLVEDRPGRSVPPSAALSTGPDPHLRGRRTELPEAWRGASRLQGGHTAGRRGRPRPAGPLTDRPPLRLGTGRSGHRVARRRVAVCPTPAPGEMTRVRCRCRPLWWRGDTAALSVAWALSSAVLTILNAAGAASKPIPTSLPTDLTHGLLYGFVRRTRGKVRTANEITPNAPRCGAAPLASRRTSAPRHPHEYGHMHAHTHRPPPT